MNNTELVYQAIADITKTQSNASIDNVVKHTALLHGQVSEIFIILFEDKRIDAAERDILRSTGREDESIINLDNVWVR